MAVTSAAVGSAIVEDSAVVAAISAAAALPETGVEVEAGEAVNEARFVLTRPK
jgi:F0F1-type ATP synthase membrane subunit c/vacuolar-type H+-ATPase subunit K